MILNIVHCRVVRRIAPHVRLSSSLIYRDIVDEGLGWKVKRIEVDDLEAFRQSEVEDEGLHPR
jgi:hypothetical protein